MRRHPFLIALAAVLVAAAPAAAKEISKVAVCGKGSECVTYDKSDRLDLMAAAEDAGQAPPPARQAPFYRVRMTVDTRAEGGGLDSWTIVYVPSAGLLRVRDEVAGYAWVTASPAAKALFDRAARKLTPFAASSLGGLNIKPPEAQIDSIFQPAAEPASAPAADTGAPWGWIGAGGAAAALVLGSVLMLRRRRRSGPAGAPATAA